MNLVNEVSRYTTVRDLWDGLVVTYGSGSDPLLIWDLHQQANEMKQGGMTLEELWKKFQDLWILIDTRDPNPMSYPSEIEKYNLREQRHRLYQFVRALDNRYDGIKKEIINKDPLPSVRQAYGMVQREANSGVLKPESKELPNNGIGSGLAVVNRPPPPGHSPYTANRSRTGEDNKSKLTCSHCGGKKHTKEGCFLLIGFPEWWDEMKRARVARGGRHQSGNHGGRAAVAAAGGGWTNVDRATIAGPPAGSTGAPAPSPSYGPIGHQSREAS